MRTANLNRGLLALAAGVLLGPVTAAQICADPSDLFWKWDALEDAPVGMPAGAHVLRAVCEDDAMGTAFRMPPGAPPQHIKQVSMGFGHVLGETDHGAILNIEVYEGTVGWNPGGLIVMPPKVFDLQAEHGETAMVMSTGITAFDLSEYNIVVDDNFTVVFRMLANLSFPGCPDAVVGSDANILTDGTGCNPFINVLDERNVGWVDPANWEFQFGSPICPQFYTGNWIIRACTETAGAWTDLGHALAGTSGAPTLDASGPLTPGSFNPLVLSGALPGASSYIFLGLFELDAPFKGGVLVPTPDVILGPIPADGAGGWTIVSEWPADIPAGLSLWWQVWISDPGGPVGFAATNGVQSTAP